MRSGRKTIPDESTAQSLARDFETRGVSRDCIKSLDLETLYRSLKSTSATAFGGGVQVLTPPNVKLLSNDPVWAVIVETREHPLLEFVVCQFARDLEIGIQIFHGPKNRDFITSSEIGGLVARKQVHLTDLRIREFTRRTYNELLLHRSFWGSILGRRKILIFQTDSVLCSNSTYCLDNFTHFDYIGSNWPRTRPIGIVVDGGSGGLSLRDWDLSINCLDRFPAIRWPGGEDGYFAFHFDLMGGSVAREMECAEFSTQTDFLCKSFGAHQIRHLEKGARQQFIEYCPEARFMLK